jgi:hypothetical protein
MNLFKRLTKTSVKKASMKMSTGSLTQTLRLLTGKESKFHSPLTDLDQRPSHQPQISTQLPLMLKEEERIFPRKALMRTFTGSLTQTQRP